MPKRSSKYWRYPLAFAGIASIILGFSALDEASLDAKGLLPIHHLTGLPPILSALIFVALFGAILGLIPALVVLIQERNT